MACYGAIDGTAILQNDFWNSLKDISESTGSWTLFERQQQKGNSGILHVKEDGVGKIICHFPIRGTEWNLVVGIDESYLSGIQQSFRGPIVNLIVKISISIAVALIIITAINILVRIKASEHSKVLEDKADTDLLTDLNNKMATERKIREYMEKYPTSRAYCSYWMLITLRRSMILWDMPSEMKCSAAWQYVCNPCSGLRISWVVPVAMSSWCF